MQLRQQGAELRGSDRGRSQHCGQAVVDVQGRVDRPGIRLGGDEAGNRMRRRQLLLPVPPGTLSPFLGDIEGLDEGESLHDEQPQAAQRLGGGADGHWSEDCRTAGEDLDVRLGADERDGCLLVPAVKDDGSAVSAHLRPGLLLDRGSRMRQGRVVQCQARMRHPGGGRLGDEEQQTGGNGSAEHLVGGDERNITIIIEERGADLVRRQCRAQTMIDRQCQQE